jgi:hypothetical protein
MTSLACLTDPNQCITEAPEVSVRMKLRHELDRPQRRERRNRREDQG